jgi:hypothetical protein
MLHVYLDWVKRWVCPPSVYHDPFCGLATCGMMFYIMYFLVCFILAPLSLSKEVSISLSPVGVQAKVQQWGSHLTEGQDKAVPITLDGRAVRQGDRWPSEASGPMLSCIWLFLLVTDPSVNNSPSPQPTLGSSPQSSGFSFYTLKDTWIFLQAWIIFTCLELLIEVLNFNSDPLTPLFQFFPSLAPPMLFP